MIAHFVGHTDKKVTKTYMTTTNSTDRMIVEKIPNWEEEPSLKVV